MKTIKKAIAVVLTALMVLSSVPLTGVFATQDPGMTLDEFKSVLTTRMETFYTNITPEQATIIKTMGDGLKTSNLSHNTIGDMSSAWDTILTPSILNATLLSNYSSTDEAKQVLSNMIYSALGLMFYLNTDNSKTDSEKLRLAIENAYTKLYLPMDKLAGAAFTRDTLSSILTEVRSTISGDLAFYAGPIINAMDASTAVNYVNIIANNIVSVAVTKLFTSATSGSLFTLKNNFATNAGFTPEILGDVFKKVYVASAIVEATQKAPSVQFNLLINDVIKFQGSDQTSAPISFDQAITLNSATTSEVILKVGTNRTVAGIDLNMTSYFVADTTNNSNIQVTKIEPDSDGYYFKIKALPNIVDDAQCVVNVYRKSPAGENYFFKIMVNVTGTHIYPIDKSALTTAINTATELMNGKVVGFSIGNVPASARNTFQQAITAATVVKNSLTATQTDINNAVTTLATATTAFNAAVIVPAPANVLLKKVGDPTFELTFDTLADATAYIKSPSVTDAVKGPNNTKTVNYYAVPKDNSTQLLNRNMSKGKIVVSFELADNINPSIPAGAVVWISTNTDKTPSISSTDFYTKGTNAFPTIAAAVDAAISGAEIVIKDGEYAGVEVTKKVLIRNGSNPIITGNMIFDAQATGSTIEGITFGTGAGGVATITVNSPNITIANLNLDNVVLQVNASNVAIQNVTATHPPVATSVITVNAPDTTISGFSFTTDTNTVGAAIKVAAGITNTTITDSVVLNNVNTIKYETSVANPTPDTSKQGVIYSAAPVIPVTTSNDVNTETNVVYNIRKDVSADGTIKAIVYLTGIDMTKDIDIGKAVVGYTFKNLTPTAITGIVTAGSSSYQVLSPVGAIPNTGLIDVEFCRTPGAPGHPKTVSIKGVPTDVLDLFSVTFDLPDTATVGDVYSIWLSKTSPNTIIKRSVDQLVPGTQNGETQPVSLPMLFTVSSSYILESVASVTLSVHMQFSPGFEVKDNQSQSAQGFKISIQDLTAGSDPEIYNIYTNSNPQTIHSGATLTSTVVNGNVSEYVLSIPGCLPNKQYNVTITGEGYSTVTRTSIINTDLALYVWSNIRSKSEPNFLAGDITTEGNSLEIVNNSDFAALASKYGKTSADVVNYATKYDLNRDQKINLDDINMLLLNMKLFRTTYENVGTGTAI